MKAKLPLIARLLLGFFFRRWAHGIVKSFSAPAGYARKTSRVQYGPYGFGILFSLSESHGNFVWPGVAFRLLCAAGLGDLSADHHSYFFGAYVSGARRFAGRHRHWTADDLSVVFRQTVQRAHQAFVPSVVLM